MSESAATTPLLVRLEHHTGPSGERVGVVRLDRPKVNAISPELTADLAACVAELAANPPGAVIVYGGPKIFAAGADIARFGGPDESGEIVANLHRAFDALASLPRMVIAAVAGYALGGGCELSLACDVRIASESAVFGQPEILLGIIPGGGGTQRLARLVGPSRAKEICLSGRQVKADEAFRIGLADRVVPTETLFDEALLWAYEFARGPLTVQGYCKAAIDDGLTGSLADGLRRERELFVDCFRTEDAPIGIKSFLEHGPGKAAFTGR